MAKNRETILDKISSKIKFSTLVSVKKITLIHSCKKLLDLAYQHFKFINHNHIIKIVLRPPFLPEQETFPTIL